jgi:hypothetical protein
MKLINPPSNKSYKSKAMVSYTDDTTIDKQTREGKSIKN